MSKSHQVPGVNICELIDLLTENGLGECAQIRTGQKKGRSPMKNEKPGLSRRKIVTRSAQLGALGAVGALALAKNADAHSPAWKVAPGVVDITARGADPTGTVDCVSFIQDALDDLVDPGNPDTLGRGGIVLFPPGDYKLASQATGFPTINVHDGCGLVGVGGWRGNKVSAGGYEGASLVISGAVDENNPVLWVNKGFVIENLLFRWDSPLDLDPDIWGPAIAGGDDTHGANGVLKDLVFYNASTALKFGHPTHSNGRLTISNVYAFCYECFLEIVFSKEAITVDNLVVSGAAIPANEPDRDDARQYAQEHCKVFKIGQADGFRANNVAVNAARTFLSLEGTGNAEMLNLASFSNVMADGVPVVIESDGNIGISNTVFSNSVFVPREVPKLITGALDPEGAIVLNYGGQGVEQRHNLTFTGCVFRKTAKRILYVQKPSDIDAGLEFVRFNGCQFLQWPATQEDGEIGENLAAIRVNDPLLHVNLNDCTFAALRDGLTFPPEPDLKANPLGVQAIRYASLRVSNCTFLDCKMPLVIYGDKAPYDNTNVVVQGCMTIGTPETSKSVTRVSNYPSACLIRSDQNLWDEDSDINRQCPVPASPTSCT